jgi:hypothetical protein
MRPTLVALRDLAREATRPLVLWAARWIDARHPWADSVLTEEARAAVRRGRGCVPWSPSS